MKVRIIKHCCVPFEGRDYTRMDGNFELPDGIARKLIDGGTCAEAGVPAAVEEEPDGGDSDEAHELLPLLPASRASVICDALDEADYRTAESVANADVEDLVALHGIGEKTAEMLKELAATFVNANEE